MKTIFKNSLATISLCALLGACATVPEMPTLEVIKNFTLPADTKWQKLETVAYRGKQDDIFFLNADLGWYVNGGGKIYKTIDGDKLPWDGWSRVCQTRAIPIIGFHTLDGYRKSAPPILRR
jgi:hypothetical protein